MQVEHNGDCSRCLTHFNNWKAKHDQWVELPREQQRLAPYRTYSANNQKERSKASGGGSAKRKPAKRKASGEGPARRSKR